MADKKNKKDTKVPPPMETIDDTGEQFYIDNYLNDPNNIYEPAIKKSKIKKPHVNTKKSNIRNKNWTMTHLI